MKNITRMSVANRTLNELKKTTPQIPSAHPLAIKKKSSPNWHTSFIFIFFIYYQLTIVKTLKRRKTLTSDSWTNIYSCGQVAKLAWIAANKYMIMLLFYLDIGFYNQYSLFEIGLITWENNTKTVYDICKCCFAILTSPRHGTFTWSCSCLFIFRLRFLWIKQRYKWT